MLQQFFGTELDFWVRLAVSLIVIAALLGLTALILRRMSRKSGAPMVARPRTGRSRISVVDAVPVDQERRLVLVRRDDTEHLLLTGGASDLVVEHNIPVRAEGTQTVREAIAPRTPEQVAHAREPVIAAPAEKPAFPTRGEKALEAPSLSVPEPELKAEPLSIRDHAELKTPDSFTDESLLPESIRNRHARRAFEPSVAAPLATAAAIQGAGAIRPRMPALAEQTASEEKPDTEADRTDDVRASAIPLISEDDLLDSGDLIVTGQDDDQEEKTADDTSPDQAKDKDLALAEAAAREAEERAAIEAAEQEAREIARQAQEREHLEAAERAAAREAAESAAREEEALAAIAAAEREAEERATQEAAERAAEQEALEAAAREAEEREQAEREAAERAAIAEAERQAQAEREAAERAAIAAAEQAAAERAAREAAEQEAAERAAIEAAEREAAELAVQEAAEQAAREAAEREAQQAAEERAAIEAAEQEAAAIAAFEAAAREVEEREAAAREAREAHEAAEREAARAAAEALALDEKIAAEMAEVLQEMEQERQAQADIAAQQDDRVKDIAARLDSALNAPADFNAQGSASQDNSPHLSLSDLLDDLQDAGNSAAPPSRPVMPEAPHLETSAEPQADVPVVSPVEPQPAPEAPTAEPRTGSRFGQIFSRTNASYGRPRIDASPRTPVAPPRPPLRTEPLARPRNVASGTQRDPAVPLLGAAHREPQSVDAGREQVSAPRIRPPSPMTSRRADILPSVPGMAHPSVQPAGHVEDRAVSVIDKPAQNDPATDFLEDFESEIANLLGRTPGSKL